MLTDLQNCKSIYDLASLLDIPAKTLAYLLYKLPDTLKYTDKCLSKKSGGIRQIKAPEPRLKELQARLSDVLYSVIGDLEDQYGKRRSFGFEKGVGIFENALCHSHKRWVFNVDIADFFPSINFGRVISFFKKSTDFQLDPKIATLIAQIACHKNELPQGAPSSPVISNLICGSLDYRLSKLAKRARCDYSRYVDDITFSTNERRFSSTIAVEKADHQGWEASEELVSRIASSGFALNLTKTRMSYRRSRQVVTGLVVNSKPAAKREMYKNSRAAVHHIMRGMDWHIEQYCSPFRLNCEDEESTADPFAVLQGRMSFIYHLDSRTDKRKDSAKFFHPSAIARTYADLQFLKYFTRSDIPIVLTEGLSDILYIRAALRNLGPIPGLSSLAKNQKLELLFDFYRFPEHPSRLLGLSGGSGNLSLFIERLYDFQRRLSTNVARRPLIILLDNDEGLKGIDGTVKNKFGVDITISRDEAFYKLSPKTFVIKTPHLPTGNAKSCVEDFLDSRALAVKLNGKSFTPKNNYDPNDFFGKVVLSKYVYDNCASLSFANFKPILDRLNAAITAA